MATLVPPPKPSWLKRSKLHSTNGLAKRVLWAVTPGSHPIEYRSKSLVREVGAAADTVWGQMTPFGPGAHVGTSGSNGFKWPNSDRFMNANIGAAWSIVVFANITNANIASGQFVGFPANQSGVAPFDDLSFNFGGGGSNVSWANGNSGTNAFSQAGPTIPAGFSMYGFSWNGSTGIAWRDLNVVTGLTNGGTAISRPQFAGQPGYLFTQTDSAGSSWTGDVLAAYVINGALNQSDWLSIAGNPWQIFEPDELPTGASTVNPNVSVMGVSGTGHAGTVTPSISTNPPVTGVSGTGLVGSLTVSVNSIMAELYASGSSMTIQTFGKFFSQLSGLANGGIWNSLPTDNMSPEYLDVEVRASLLGTAGSTGPCDIFVFGSADAGSTYTDTSNLLYLGSVRMNGASPVVAGPFSVAAAFGGMVPPQWGVAVLNRSGSALDSSTANQTIAFQGRELLFTSSRAALDQSVGLTGIAKKSGGFGVLSFSQPTYVVPTKDGFTLVQDYSFGTPPDGPGTLVTAADLAATFSVITGTISGQWPTFSNSTANANISTQLKLTTTLPVGTTSFDPATLTALPSGSPINAGAVQTVFSQEFGYWEANVLVPKPRGMFSYLQITPATGLVPPGIDVAKWIVNGTQSTTTSTHVLQVADGSMPVYSSVAGGYTTSTDTYSPGFDYSLGFHTFAVDWEPGSVAKYVDGVLVAVETLNWVNSSSSLNPSPDGTVDPPTTPIVDSQLNVWNITPGGRITLNGTVQATTSGVTQLLYYHGMVYQLASGLWSGWDYGQWNRIPRDPRT